MENNHIDKTFNEASRALEEPVTFPGFDKVWSKVEEKLDQKQEKKRIVPVWISYGIAASLAVGSGIFYFTHEKRDLGTEQTIIAQKIISPENPSMNISEPIQKTDSIVRANIRKEVIPIVPMRVASRKIRHMYTSLSTFHIEKLNATEPFNGKLLPIAENKIKDTLRRKNIEEVIAVGVKKEKTVTVSSLEIASQKRRSALNIVPDTAETAYSLTPFNLAAQIHEPEILAYGKKTKPDKLIIASSGVANQMGTKSLANSIGGLTPGINVNSISGTEGSGKVDISMSCQNSSKPHTNPLIVVDGVVSDLEDFRKLDPKKIENISIIKTPKTKTSYSEKAKNGVVVVETKDISKKEKRKLKKFLEKELPQK